MSLFHRAIVGLGIILAAFAFCKLGMIALMNNRFDLCYLCIVGALICLYASFGGFNDELMKYDWFRED